jgi:hypothetical protein
LGNIRRPVWPDVERELGEIASIAAHEAVQGRSRLIGPGEIDARDRAKSDQKNQHQPDRDLLT